jgi:coenzyme F420-0:L-glutamate ligase/coenzyme F420-1:gamma-L-glutamate ligase
MSRRNRGAPAPADRLEIIALPGIADVTPGADLAVLLHQAAESSGLSLGDGDVVVVTQKIVSKAEGRIVELRNVTPSVFANQIAGNAGKDPRLVEVILSESKRIVRMDGGVIIAETHHGLVCANAGVDASNLPEGCVCLLPTDPDASALRLLEQLAARTGKRLGVIISDTFGRPWREGLVNVAIGVAGLAPLIDWRGQRDGHGHVLSGTVMAAADELASAAELVMGKSARRPAAVIRHYLWSAARGKAAELIRPPERDLFR